MTGVLEGVRSAIAQKDGATVPLFWSGVGDVGGQDGGEAWKAGKLESWKAWKAGKPPRPTLSSKSTLASSPPFLYSPLDLTD